MNKRSTRRLRRKLLVSLVRYNGKLARLRIGRNLCTMRLLFRSRRSSVRALLRFVLTWLRPNGWGLIRRYYRDTRPAPHHYRRNLALGTQAPGGHLVTGKARRLQERLAAWYLQSEFDIRPTRPERRILGQYRELAAMGAELLYAAGVGRQPWLSDEDRYRCRVVFPGYVALSASRFGTGRRMRPPRGLKSRIKRALLRRRLKISLHEVEGIPNLYPAELDPARLQHDHETLRIRADKTRRALEVGAVQATFADYLGALALISTGPSCPGSVYLTLMEQIEDIYSPILYQEEKQNEYME